MTIFIKNVNFTFLFYKANELAINLSGSRYSIVGQLKSNMAVNHAKRIAKKLGVRIATGQSNLTNHYDF